MTSGKVRMLVMSDLHCTSAKPGDDAASYLTTSTPTASHPIEALLTLIKAEALEADLVLCAGDICNKADASGLNYAWVQMHRVATALGADLVATVGNHDLDHSGQALDLDPKAALVDLEPHFPFDDENQKHRFWSEDFAIYRRDGMRVVTLNSCALHGHVFGRKPEEWASRKAEIEHGRISPATAKRLQKALSDDGDSYDVNVLLTHHHVIQLPNVDISEASVMLQAQELLEALSASGPWLIIHGHKHRARLFYGSGGSDAPVVMAAGTFSAFPYGQAQSQPQVYLIEFADPSTRDNAALTIAGNIRAWTWSASTGKWGTATSSDDGVLPAISGFGWRITAAQLAKRLAAEARAAGGKLDGAALRTRIPELEYVLPIDLRHAIDRLGSADPKSTGELGNDGRIGSVETLQAPVMPDGLSTGTGSGTRAKKVSRRSHSADASIMEDPERREDEKAAQGTPPKKRAAKASAASPTPRTRTRREDDGNAK